jgi:sulfate adenylyltransferase subunit 2
MLTYLRELEVESISILRETAAQFERPHLLYSMGKDSSVLLHLTKKAFYPNSIPFPLIHVDTGYKFPEMYSYREQIARQTKLLIYRNEEAIKEGCHPLQQGTKLCCSKLKTEALLAALDKYEVDAAIGGARRDEERSRSKERIFSFRNKYGHWEPKSQRPELWRTLNGRIDKGESMRVFPLSNWTEFDVWNYIKQEGVEIVPLYFAKKRWVVKQGATLIVTDNPEAQEVSCRYRSLGCAPCSGVVSSTASNVDEIIEELQTTRLSERVTRVIDYDQDGSMERKKMEGYF